jgi:hypothetical protein
MDVPLFRPPFLPEGASMIFPRLRQCAGVIIFRIGDLGFRIQNTKTKFENYLTIPQSAFANPQSRYSNTPKQLAIFTGKAIEL